MTNFTILILAFALGAVIGILVSEIFNGNRNTEAYNDGFSDSMNVQRKIQEAENAPVDVKKG